MSRTLDLVADPHNINSISTHLTKLADYLPTNRFIIPLHDWMIANIFQNLSGLKARFKLGAPFRQAASGKVN